MRAKSILGLLVTILWLTACASPTAVPTVVVTKAPFRPAPTSSTPGAYPNPGILQPTSNPYPAVEATLVSPTFAYPEPGTPAIGGAKIPPSGFEPQAGDANLKRDQASVDLANSQVVEILGEPVQAEAILIGGLAGCQALRVVVTPPDANNIISLDVYTVVEPGSNCTTGLQPFSATIPLGSYSGGPYSVMVNGERLGEFYGSLSPQPGDEQLTRGEVTLDMDLSQLLTIPAEAGEEAVFLQGYLPTPCHQLRLGLSSPDTQNRINIEIYSVVDPQTICNMVVVPYQITVPLGQDLSGHYTVYVNGQVLGEFEK